MILNPAELDCIKPALHIAMKATGHVTTVIKYPSQRQVTIELAPSMVIIKAEYPDQPPVAEYYRTPQGCAQAYGVQLNRVMYTSDVD